MKQSWLVLTLETPKKHSKLLPGFQRPSMALIGRGRVLGRKITSDGVHSGPREEPDEPDKEDGLPVWPAEEGKGPERGSAVTRQRDRNIVIGCDPPQRQRVGGARRPCWNCWLFWPRKIFWDGLTMMMMMTMTDVDVFFFFVLPVPRRQFPSREHVRLFALLWSDMAIR